MEDIKALKNKAEKALKGAQTLRELDEIEKAYLGRNGELTSVLRSLSKLPAAQKAQQGNIANTAKSAIEFQLAKRRAELMGEESRREEEAEWIDVTAPGKKIEKGHLHPLSQIQRQAQEIFSSMGFYIAQGPHVETEWYNFDALNIPANHPARDLWDTFWLKEKDPKTNKPLLLRTHTSPVQIRYMEHHQPPFQIIAPGHVFRYEATDAHHEFDLMQLEGLVVGKHISVANFRATILEFYRQFFQTHINIRLRPSFFPFVEPGFEVDMKIGQGDWLEMMGAGMVHQNVFLSAGYIPGEWTGFAFGMGLDRLAMMQYKIDDVRLFRSCNLEFLYQF